MYNLEVKRVAEEIQRHEASKVLLQLPDGLRPTAFALLRDLKQQTDATIILSGDSCYGACDLATTQARAVNADMIVHYGHSKMIEAEIPVVYVNASYDFNVQKLMKKALPLVEEWKGIGLTTTIQHVHRLPEVSLFLEEKGLKPFIGISNTLNLGQITGCNYDAATKIVSKVQGYLF